METASRHNPAFSQPEKSERATNKTGVWVAETVDSSGDVGNDTSLALGDCVIMG